MKTKFRLQGMLIGIVVAIVLMGSFSAIAAGVVQTIDVKVNPYTVQVGETTLNTTTYLIDGRTYVAVRDLCNALNQNLTVNEGTIMIPNTSIPSTPSTNENTTPNDGTTLNSPPPGNGSTEPAAPVIPAPRSEDDSTPIYGN
jgi:Tol biopolymer transport system component